MKRQAKESSLLHSAMRGVIWEKGAGGGYTAVLVPGCSLSALVIWV